MLTFYSTLELPDGGTRESTKSPLQPGPILFPVYTDDNSPQALQLAMNLAESIGSTLVLVGLEVVPDQTPLDHPQLPTESDRLVEAALEWVDAFGSEALSVSMRLRRGRSIAHMIDREIEKRRIQTVVLEQTDGTTGTESLFGDSIDSIFESVECDVVLATGAEHLEQLSTILVPIAGGPHSGLAVDIAKAIAVENDAWIELFHVIEPEADNDSRRDGERYIEAGLDRLGDFDRVDTWLFEAPDVAEAIIEQTQYYDITVLGAPQTGRLRRFVFGSKSESVRERAESTVITARSADVNKTWFERWLGRPA